MSRGKRSMQSEMLFVLFLGLVCSLILIATRAGVGSKSEIQPDTVMTLLQIIAGRPPDNAQEAMALFSRRFLQKSSGRIKIWQNQDQLQQWVFEATGSGMWGEIILVGAVDLETETMLGMKVLSQNETAGLGNRIAEPVFAEQFANLSLLPKIEMSHGRYKNNQFDAVSGATQTSRALETLLNRAVDMVRHQARKKS